MMNQAPTAAAAAITFPYAHPLYGRLERFEDAELLTAERLAEHMTANPVADDVTSFGACPRCYFQTSGSSGTPKQVPYSAADLERQAVHEARSFAVGGLTGEDVVLSLASPPPSLSAWATARGSERLGARLANSSYVDFDAPIEHGEGDRATFVFGTPLMLELIGETCVETWGSVSAAFPNVRRGIVYGDLLPAALERRVQALWNIDFTFLYGSVEADVIAMSCPTGDGRLHVMDEKVVVELIPGDQARPGTRTTVRPSLVPIADAPSGMRGEVVVSDLQRDYLPLIRYQTGDMVEVRRDRCDCGRDGPALRILGRRRNTIDLGSRPLQEIDVHEAIECALGRRWVDWTATVTDNGGVDAHLDLRVQVPERAFGDERRVAAALRELGIVHRAQALDTRLSVSFVKPGSDRGPTPTGDVKADRLAFA